ncbi:MAG: PEP-CTERM sorting domain-containing protein [Cyanobacteria bacterium P01_G01_bin.54]
MFKNRSSISASCRLCQALLCSLTIAPLLNGAIAQAATFTDTATGSLNPTQVDALSIIENGDFVIRHAHLFSPDFQPTSATPPIGDGKNEWTFWDFDFREDANFAAIDTHTQITSAILTLELYAYRTGTDFLQIQGLERIQPTAITYQPYRQWSTVEVDLLDFYSADELHQAWTGQLDTETFAWGTARNEDYVPTAGILSMLYADDALVSSAEINITTTDPEETAVPEPGMFLGLAAIAGIGFATRRLHAEQSHA